MNPLTRWLAGIVLLGLACAGSFGAGWHAKGVSVKAGQVDVAHAEVGALTDSVNKQATTQHAQLQHEQDKSLALAIEQRRQHSAALDIHLEIDHAAFPPPTVAGSCPDPAGSAEFVRLYDRAARGAEPAPARSTAAGGVHAPGD